MSSRVWFCKKEGLMAAKKKDWYYARKTPSWANSTRNKSELRSSSEVRLFCRFWLIWSSRVLSWTFIDYKNGLLLTSGDWGGRLLGLCMKKGIDLFPRQLWRLPNLERRRDWPQRTETKKSKILGSKFGGTQEALKKCDSSSFRAFGGLLIRIWSRFYPNFFWPATSKLADFACLRLGLYTILVISDS